MKAHLLTSFRARAMAGAAIIIALLAGGMSLTIHRLDAAATQQVEHIRAEELAITLAERLRWTGELIVSAGRGYLFSGDRVLLAKLHKAQSDFDQGVRALKNNAAVTLSGGARIAEIERAANDFMRDQGELVIARQQSADLGGLARRFDEELLPLQGELGRSLDRFVDTSEAALNDVYNEAARDRGRLTSELHGLVASLVASTLVISWLFATRLAQAYRKEKDAVSTAQKALSARDELLAILAHDLRNPLGAITMKATLLRKTAESEKTRQQAESIENVTMRMEYLIKNMLDAATMEAGQFSVTPAQCIVEDLLRDTTEMFGPLAASKQIRLVQKASEPGLAFRADRERVLELLSNLLGNAIKFTPQRGEVTISIERQGEMVCFAVADTGPGITGEHLPHIFNRFWKFEASGKKGTGLGLFIAKGIVDAHGGRIWAESAPGRGATFYFTLPIAKSPGTDVARAEPDDSLTRAARA